MMKEIEYNEEVFMDIKRHGESTFPNECCGFLFGTDGEKRCVSISQRVVNKAKGDQRRRFEIAPFDFVKAERFALQEGVDFLGVYHSHPNHPAIASEHDLAQALPYFSYTIISIRDGKYDHILAWRLKDDLRVFIQEKLIIK